ncbi:hypothetical protein QWY20_11510 [Alkalimonas sp. MEB108]|uniref:Uncharacterized protein n=1 Tax=Alkalimonas cellulosilytica TaxID=3058395 RepID=A0ABU7J6F4_9GAMM|nr:hypothetical protein [Alkalimonas sp. MEB108]MEE2002081.1 hypothetical protein [Alkalimonas sp. MEB108]
MQELTFEQVDVVSGGYYIIPDTLNDFFQQTGGFWDISSSAGFIDNDAGRYESPSDGSPGRSFTPSEKGFIVAFTTYLGAKFGNAFGAAAMAYVGTVLAESGTAGGNYQPVVPDYMAP